MQLVLHGEINTPIISKRTTFRLEGYQARIINPRRRYYSKIVTRKPMFPYSFICYLGYIEIKVQCRTLSQAKRKLTKILQIKSIGRYWSEGMGQIQWLDGYIEKRNIIEHQIEQHRKLKIRKGLPPNLPIEIQLLIHYALLHDFYHNSRHRSKIYVEPELEDIELIELLKQHHEKTDKRIISVFQKYDRLAARISRKIRSPRTSRYNWYATETIDFTKLANEIKEVAHHPWKLYEYIHTSKELSRLNESLEHGYTALRSHLLIIANLIVQDFQQKRLEDYCTIKETRTPLLP